MGYDFNDLYIYLFYTIELRIPNAIVLEIKQQVQKKIMNIQIQKTFKISKIH